MPEILLLPSGFPGDSGTREVPSLETDVGRDVAGDSSYTMLSPGEVNMFHLSRDMESEAKGTRKQCRDMSRQMRELKQPSSYAARSSQ